MTLFRKLLLPVLVLAGWAWISSARYVRPLFLPSPDDLWTAFGKLLPVLPEALASSVFMTLSGFFLGVVAGSVSALLMAYSFLARMLFGGVLAFIRPVPIFALIPLFVLWFGIGRSPQIALIAVGTSVIISLATIEAIRNVPSIFIRAALVLGADRSRIYSTVIVPAMTPHLLGAIRAALAASWGLDVAAEFIGAQNGLGRLIIVRQEYLDSASMIVIVIIYSLLALTTDWIVQRLERPLLRWTERSSQGGAIAAVVGASR